MTSGGYERSQRPEGCSPHWAITLPWGVPEHSMMIEFDGTAWRVVTVIVR